MTSEGWGEGGGEEVIEGGLKKLRIFILKNYFKRYKNKELLFSWLYIRMRGGNGLSMPDNSRKLNKDSADWKVLSLLLDECTATLSLQLVFMDLSSRFHSGTSFFFFLAFILFLFCASTSSLLKMCT